MDYSNEIEREAVNFLLNHEEMIVEALKENKDFDRNDIDDLDTAFHENIVDKAYTTKDAAYVIDNCRNPETDSGLWEGQEPIESLQSMAAWSFAHDVWVELMELYDTMNKRRKEIFEEPEDPANEGDDPLETAAQKAFDEFYNEYKKQFLPVEKDSEEEISLIRRWLRVDARDAGMRGGGPVGSSYIDSRCGVGYGMEEVKDYVDFDHECSQRVPWLSGMYRPAVQVRYDALIEKKRDIFHSEPSDPKDPYTHKIVDKIWKDARLSVSDIREIAETLLGKVN